RAVLLGGSVGWEACVVRSRAAEAGASAVRPAAKSPLRGCLSLRPLVVRGSNVSSPRAATEQAFEPSQPNVPSARSAPEIAISGARSSFVPGRRAQLFARPAFSKARLRPVLRGPRRNRSGGG